jgi:hypothetical protein
MPPKQLTQWEELLRENLPRLSLAQVTVLALYSFAVASSGSCGLTSVAMCLALLLQLPWQRLRQRLREFYKPAETKRGKQRRELDVSWCFASLLSWIVRLSKSDRVALAMDATTLSDRFAILSISVLYRGTAIPVAWCVLAGNTKGAWKPQWLRMFQLLSGAVAPEVFVLVCADRGLYAKWLFTAICACGWHPYLRVNDQGSFRSSDGRCYSRFSDVLEAAQHEVRLSGVAFSSNPVACTLLAYQSPEHKDPWLVLTDLPADQAHVQWYGLRSWIEQGFKAIKRGAFHWQRTRMSDPARVERLWLVLAVATLLLVVLATRQEDAELAQYDLRHSPSDAANTAAEAATAQAATAQTATAEAATAQAATAGQPRTANGSHRRRLRLPRLGHLVLLGLLFSQQALGTLYLDPEPWCDHPPWIDPAAFKEQLTEHPP